MTQVCLGMHTDDMRAEKLAIRPSDAPITMVLAGEVLAVNDIWGQARYELETAYALSSVGPVEDRVLSLRCVQEV
jgi:hypothetical protein